MVKAALHGGSAKRHITREHDALALQRGSGIGTAESRDFVYGWRGALYNTGAGACSTIFPRYITATWSALYFTTARSCAMNRYVS
jgi:hypothetical protein